MFKIKQFKEEHRSLFRTPEFDAPEIKTIGEPYVFIQGDMYGETYARLFIERFREFDFMHCVFFDWSKELRIQMLEDSEPMFEALRGFLPNPWLHVYYPKISTKYVKRLDHFSRLFGFTKIYEDSEKIIKIKEF